MTFVTGPVAVTVPATSANLGPGFDTFGVALGLRDRLEGEVIDSGLQISVDGAGCDEVPLDETHLVVRSMRAAFAQLGSEPSGLRLHCRNLVPHARGLGSSSAAIVGGIALARALVAGGTLLMSDEQMFDLAADLEGHPDNVAPACFGGFVVSGRGDDGWFAVPGDVDPRVGAVVFVPDGGVRTEVARGLLPASVPHAAAAANSGRAALMVLALGGRPEHLFAATADLLHQEYRRSAMPESLDLVDRLRGDRVPAVISGAGPTVLAFCGVDDDSCDPLLDRAPDGWLARRLELDTRGVIVE